MLVGTSKAISGAGDPPQGATRITGAADQSLLFGSGLSVLVGVLTTDLEMARAGRFVSEYRGLPKLEFSRIKNVIREEVENE